MSAQGRPRSQQVDDAPRRIRNESRHEARQPAGQDAQRDGIGEQPAHDLGRRGFGALDQQRRGDHHHRQMHRDEQEERHRALLAIGLEDHRDADEHGVRLPGQEPGHHGGRPGDAEQPPADQRADPQTTATARK
jgi:hypothetical protein